MVVLLSSERWHVGAHGVCGILLTLMQCYSELEELYPGQAASLVMGGVGGLLSQTLPSGNLLSSLGSENDKWASSEIAFSVFCPAFTACALPDKCQIQQSTDMHAT